MQLTAMGERAAEHRHRQVAFLEQAHQPPETDAAAVFEHTFAGEVAPPHALIEAMRLAEAELGVPLPILHGRLGPLLVVHDEVDGEARPVRPLWIRWVRSVPHEIAFGFPRHDLLALSSRPGHAR